MNLTNKQLTTFFNQVTIQNIKDILEFSDELVITKLKVKADYVSHIVYLFMDEKFIERLLKKLNKDNSSIKLYDYLIWISPKLNTADAIKYFDLKLDPVEISGYGYAHNKKLKLSDTFILIDRYVENHWRNEIDFLVLDDNIIDILKLFYPKPIDYEFLSVKELKKTKYSYNNENGVLQFINIIQDMLKNNLVEFGKTNEKPLLKTLNILKASTGVDEFYSDKKLNSLCTDMLTRSFSYYYWKTKKFKSKEYENLQYFLSLQLDNQLDFFISRIFTAHLKKVRFDFYYSSQKDLLEVAKLILKNLISKEWVSMDNISNFCLYRKLSLDLESYDRSDYYGMKGEDDELIGEYYYNEIYYEPVLKAMLFYLGALGILELRYDDPISPHNIKAKGLPYISVWDSLKYVKLTELGLYALGINKTYQSNVIVKKELKLKFDEYKPIITIDSKDTIMMAKLEAYCDKYDDDKLILSYSKIFKDCKSHKALCLKIDAFYKLFEQDLPKVFKSFLDEIKVNSNMLKRDLKQVTIELKNNKKLLNLFMTNKKLQEITIKASGYRVLVLKDNINKLTKIVKDNGFFIEF